MLMLQALEFTFPGWRGLHAKRGQGQNCRKVETDSNDIYVHTSLINCLIQEDKVKEAEDELAKLENNPYLKSSSLNQWLVPRIRYCLEGKEKSRKGENAWDDYAAARKLFKFPKLESNIYDDVYRIDSLSSPPNAKELESLKAYIAPNMDAIQKFLSKPVKKECIITDMHTYALQTFSKSIVYYGMMQTEEGKIVEAVDTYQKVVLYGQQLTQGTMINQLIAIAIRSIGLQGFVRLLNNPLITQTKDIELIFNTLKELRKTDPISMKESLYRFEPPGFSEDTANSPKQFQIRSQVAQTNLILIETEAAIKLHYLKTGKYPKSTTDLVPAYFPEPPVDTFNKNPIKLHLEGQNLIPYSYGPDTTDDGSLIQYDPRNGTISKGDLIYP